MFNGVMHLRKWPYLLDFDPLFAGFAQMQDVQLVVFTFAHPPPKAVSLSYNKSDRMYKARL